MSITVETQFKDSATASGGSKQLLLRNDYLTPRIAAKNVFLIAGSSVAAFAVLIGMDQRLPLWGFILAGLLVSVTHQKYLSEWVHEAAHYNLLPNRAWNDVVINLFAGVFFLSDIKVYRYGHFKHHSARTFFDDQDPDTHFLLVESRRELWKGLLKDLSGWTALTMFLGGGRPRDASKFNPPAPDRRFLAAYFVMHVVLLGALAWGGAWEVYFVYYASLVVLYPTMNRIRVYGQHTEFLPENGVRLENSGTSRTIEGGWLDRILFTSELMLYHFEHHAAPGLPFRALRHVCTRDGGENRFSRTRWNLMAEFYRRLK